MHISFSRSIYKLIERNKWRKRWKNDVGAQCPKVVESQADVGDDFSEFIREKKKRRKKNPNVGLRDNLLAYINAARQECVLVYCV